VAHTIERIEVAGPDRRARRLVLQGQDEPRLTSAAAVRTLGLEAGDSLDIAALEEVERTCARDRALRILGHRDRSVSELEDRLKRDGYPSETTSLVVGRLVELELLDDRRFAASWIRARIASGIGPVRLLAELASKGVEVEVARAAVDVAMEERDPVLMARRAMGDALLETRRDRDKAFRRLVNKGFDMETIKKAMRVSDDTS
jgi:regulatory protein